MANLSPDLKQYPLNQFGLGGLDTLNLPDDILDIELADVRNMVFTDGLLQPRNGSLLYLGKPANETNSPNQLLVATDSNGVEYMIAVYGVNIYVADTINNQWIKLNQTYTPPTGGLYYGSTNWNNGTVDDRFYLANGTDDCMEWRIAITTISAVTANSDTFISLVDSSRFLGTFATETASTIAFVAATKEITDSSNGFITAGFKSGMSISVSGTSMNDGIYTIVSVTAGVIVVKETLVDESAGSSFTLTQLGIVLVQDGATALVYYYSSLNIAYNASTISFTAPSTIGDSAAGFVTAGFKPSQKITVSGTTLNDGIYTVATVSASVITVVETTLTNEVAGGSFTISTPAVNLFSPSTVSHIIPKGSTVTVPLIDVPAIPHGKILATDQTRMYVANGITNGIGSQNTFNWSVVDDPEDYTISVSPDTAGFKNIHLGKGGIIGMNFFGQYLVIEKENIMFQWIIQYSSDLLSVNFSLEPIISGDDIGPVSNSSTLEYMNTLYYPTTKQGIISFSPDTTGSQTSSGVNILSQTIQNLVTETLDFEFARTAGLGQKLYWTVALPTIGISPAVNNLVISYDLVRAAENETINSGFQIGGSAWTVFDNWNAVDIKPVNGVLYYLSANDGAVYQCDVEGNYQDAINTTPIPYTAYAESKQINLDAPANQMKPVYLYLEGYITLNTTFYVNALYNEGGSLGSAGYVINGTNSTLVKTIPFGGLARFKLGSPLLGGVDLETLQSFAKPLFFRVYIELSQALRPHNFQFQAFSNALGSFWAISKAVLMVLPDNTINTDLVLGPDTVPPLTIQSL